MSKPNVYSIVVVPGVRMNNNGTFENINEHDTWFPQNATLLTSIASKISDVPPIILDFPYSDKFRILKILSYFTGNTSMLISDQDKTLLDSLKAIYPIKKGDFVFIFMGSHGSIVHASTAGHFDFQSNKNWENRVRHGNEIDSFKPITYFYGTNRKYTENPVKCKLELSQKVYLDSLVNASGYPRITLEPTNTVTTIPYWWFFPSGSINPSPAGNLTFDNTKVTYHSSETNSYSFISFNNWTKVEKQNDGSELKSRYFFCATETASEKIFGYLPPSEEIPLSALWRPSSKMAFNQNDLQSIMDGSKTNVFWFISACHSGGFVEDTVYFAEEDSDDADNVMSSSVWVACGKNELGWAISNPHDMSYGSNFIVKLFKMLEASRRGQSSYETIKYNLFAYCRSQHSDQNPRFKTVGGLEFDGDRSRHIYFPKNGDLGPTTRYGDW